MSDPKKKDATKKDANFAADMPPVPSQAEGDRDTVEQDLAQRDRDTKPAKDKKQSAGS
jgi:hypothetical protein